jgi:hypothetical protein
LREPDSQESLFRVPAFVARVCVGVLVLCSRQCDM